MFCFKCGTQQKDGVKFCGSCGTKQPTTESSTPSVSSVSPPAQESRPATPSNPVVDRDEISVDSVSVTAETPDKDGDMRIECTVKITYEGELAVPLSKVRLIVTDPDGWPVRESESCNCESEDLTEGDENELSELTYCRVPQGVDASQMLVQPSVILYPVQWHDAGSLDLPESGRSGIAKPVRAGDLEIVGWSATCTEADDDSASYEVAVLLANRGDCAIAAAVVRFVTRSRKGKEWSTDTTFVEGMAPQETRLLTTSTYLSESVKARRGAVMALAVGASETSIVSAIPATAPEILEPDEEELSDESKGDSGSAKRIIFYGTIKWFDVADKPGDIDDLPEEFTQAKALWDQDAAGNAGEIIELLSPYVGARFIASNLSGWQELFADPSGDEIVEIEAKNVRVVGIDFSSASSIPSCKAEASFEVQVTEGFGSTDLEEWQGNNSLFADALIFYWNIPQNDNTEDLDFTCSDHQGAECVWLESDPLATPTDPSATNTTSPFRSD